jgi:hypothetical protein
MVIRALAVGAAVAALGLAGGVGWATSPQPADPDLGSEHQSAFEPLEAPRRLLDTRPGQPTFDGQLSGGGERGRGSTLAVPVAERAGIPADADTVVINITAVQPGDRGFVTVFPCGEPRPLASNLNYAPGQTIAVGAVSRVGAAGEICLHTSGRTNLVLDVIGHFPAGGFLALSVPQRLADTRPDGVSIDGDSQGTGERAARSTLALQVAGRGEVPGDARTAVLTVTVAAASGRGYLTVFDCDSRRPGTSNLNYAPGQTVANTVVTRVSADGAVCIYNFGATNLVVDIAGTLPGIAFSTLERPRRLADTRPGGTTDDGADAGGGLRPARSTLQLQVAGRGGIPRDAGAVVLNLTSVDSRENGFATVHPAGTKRPTASNLNFRGGPTIANTVVSKLGSDGSICLFTHNPSHYVVDVIGWFPGTPAADGNRECPAPPLFPTYRMVALYGNDVSDRLGALGEQPPRQAAERLARVIEPWRAGDRPVLGVFELIATIATRAPGQDGLYRSVSSAAHVQRYLDVAREYGYQLVLDIQPGRSDFLTEVQRYEEFIRQPDVGVALDPEWRVGPNQIPGQLVGQVSAAEVNQVAEYLAGIVAAEGLPQKLLIVHQFQSRMITERDTLIAPPELAVNIHMDGFGTRAQKLETYRIIAVDPPLWNGFKLFYDEDINMFSPADVLALNPVPDFISYQ